MPRRAGRKTKSCPARSSLFQVLVLIRFEKNHGAVDRGIGGIHIAEHLRPRCRCESVIAINIQLCAQFFALIAIEDPQRNTDAEPDVLIDRRIAPDIETEGRVGRSIGDREPMIGLCLIDGLQRGPQVRPRIERCLAHVVQRRSLLREIKGPVTSNCSTGVWSFNSVSSWILAVRRFTSAVCKSDSY